MPQRTESKEPLIPPPASEPISEAAQSTLENLLESLIDIARSQTIDLKKGSDYYNTVLKMIRNEVVSPLSKLLSTIFSLEQQLNIIRFILKRLHAANLTGPNSISIINYVWLLTAVVCWSKKYDLVVELLDQITLSKILPDVHFLNSLLPFQYLVLQYYLQNLDHKRILRMTLQLKEVLSQPHILTEDSIQLACGFFKILCESVTTFCARYEFDKAQELQKIMPALLEALHKFYNQDVRSQLALSLALEKKICQGQATQQTMLNRTIECGDQKCETPCVAGEDMLVGIRRRN